MYNEGVTEQDGVAMRCSSVGNTTRGRFTFWNPLEEQSKGLALLHGLGDSSANESWHETCRAIVNKFTGLTIILPSAPRRNVSLFGRASNAWYNLEGTSSRLEEECEGLEDSQKDVNSFIHELHDSGVPYDKIVVAGFSQGAALSIWAGLQTEGYAVKGIAAMSGYFLKPAKFRLSPECRGINVLMQHGTRDSLISLDLAGETRQILEKHNIKVDMMTYDMDHEMNDESLNDLMKFLKAQLE